MRICRPQSTTRGKRQTENRHGLESRAQTARANHHRRLRGHQYRSARQEDILTPETADTPAKLVYLAVQLMYLSPDPMAHHPTYFSLVRDILITMPSAWPFIEGINNYILNGDLYHALKESKKLIGHEEQILDSARKVQSLDESDRKSA
jgi:flagellar protein FlbT